MEYGSRKKRQFSYPDFHDIFTSEKKNWSNNEKIKIKYVKH